MRMERIKHHHEVFLKTSGVFSALHGRTVQYYRVLRASSLLLLYIRKTGRYRLHFYVSAKVPRLLSDCGKVCSVVVDFLMFFSFDTPPLRIVLLLWGNRARLVVCSHQSHPLSIVPPDSDVPTPNSKEQFRTLLPTNWIYQRIDPAKRLSSWHAYVCAYRIVSPGAP